MTMPDIIDEVDALHAKAKQADADLETADIEDSHAFLSISQRHHEFQDAMLNAWPAISARLREAERHMSALAAINTGLVGIGRNGTNYRQWCAWRQTHGGTDGPTAISEDLLTAIEAATREAKP